jgi:redox-sensitive bicupin YhaK (pirin superfamily)
MIEPLPLIRPKLKDLGDGFTVRRALPAIKARGVGPFIFLDEMGPVEFAPGQGLDVRPHPHIGLATVTYLFDGAIEHRDSLGTMQVIRPGDVNWMTAGRGIVHSERSPAPRRGGRLHGMQFWVALPQADAETAPAFHHVPAKDLPTGATNGLSWRLIVGRWGAHRAPVETFAPMIYLDLVFSGAGRHTLAPLGHEQTALYVVSGGVRAHETDIAPGQLALLPESPETPETSDAITLSVAGETRAIVFGGARLDGPRKLWWNFVATDPARIEAAKDAWRTQSMGRVPGETDHIPLPEH